MADTPKMKGAENMMGTPDRKPRMPRLRAWAAVMAFLTLAMLPWLPAKAVEAGPEPRRLKKPDGEVLLVSSQCVFQDELMLLTYRDGLYALTPKTGLLRRVLEPQTLPASAMLVADHDRLFALNTADHVLYPLNISGGPGNASAPIPLNGNPFEDPGDAGSQPEQVMIDKGLLYALYRPPSLNGYKTRLLAWRLADGEPVPVRAPGNLQAVSRGYGTNLTGLVMDAWTAANTCDEQARLPFFVMFDPETGDETARHRLQQPITEHSLAFAFDPETGMMLYTSGNALYRMETDSEAGKPSQEVLCAHLPHALFMEGTGDRLVPMGEGLAAVLSMDEVTVYATKPLRNARPLIIHALPAANSAHFSALNSIPGVGVIYTEKVWGDENHLAAQLISGEGPDLMFIQSDWEEVARLVDKGYCMDLGGSAVIRRHLDSSYPILQDEARRGDGIYLLPVSLDAMVLAANTALLREYGLEAPHTYEDLCLLLETWADKYAETENGVQALAAASPRDEMLNLARQMALSSQAVKQETPRFDTPLMRRLLLRAQALRIDKLDRPTGDKSWYHLPSLLSFTSFNPGMFTRFATDNPGAQMLPLTLSPEEGTMAGLPCSVGWLAISANTRNPEAALRYAESYLEALDAETRIRLYPGENTPLQASGMEERLQAMRAREADLSAMARNTSGAQKSTLEEELALLRRNIQVEESQRWLVSPEVIARYREAMRQAFVYNRSLAIIFESGDFQRPFRRWVEGQISLDEYIREADSKLRLMRMEDE